MRRQNEVIAKVEKTARYSGMEITYEEMLLLNQIHIHRILHTSSIHEFLQFMTGGRNPNSITNRLTKMVDAGILARVTEATPYSGGNFKRYFYKLGVRGIRVMASILYYSEEEKNNLLRMSRETAPPKTHAHATSVTVNRILIEIVDPSRIEFVHHLRGAVHPFFVGEKLQQEVRGVIIPDWVFETDDSIISIEIDTGTSRGNEIPSKIKRYIKRANGLEQRYKRIIVVFSVLNDALETKSHSNRYKRISSIKEQIAHVNNIPSNLSFYALQTTKTPAVMKNIYNGEQPVLLERRTVAIHRWLIRFKTVTNVTIYLGDLDRLLSPHRDKKDDGDALFYLEVEGHIKPTIVIYGEEGSVDTYHRIQENAYRLYAINQKLPSHEQIGLLVVYPSKTSMKEDVIGWRSPIPIWMTSMDLWESPDDALEKGVRFMKLVSSFKKVWEEWEVLQT